MGSNEISMLLRDIARGKKEAFPELVTILYGELRRLAAFHMNNERQDHTLQPTALVNEAYLRLAHTGGNWHDRAHFLAAAAQVMRHVLIDHARIARRQRRGGGISVSPLNENVVGASIEELLLFDIALDKLAAIDAQQARIIEMRVFSGMTESEIGTVLKISERTIRREWSSGQAWLARQLRGHRNE